MPHLNTAGLTGGIAALGLLAACSGSEEPRNSAINTDGNQDVATQTSGANSFTEDQARGRIEGAGYDNVSGLQLTDDGLWRGQAEQNGRTVDVSVDYRGAVATGQAAATNAADASAIAPDAGQTTAAAAEDRGADATATTGTVQPMTPEAQRRQIGERG